MPQNFNAHSYCQFLLVDNLRNHGVDRAQWFGDWDETDTADMLVLMRLRLMQITRVHFQHLSTLRRVHIERKPIASI